MRPTIWPFARNRMTPDERFEVEAWTNEHRGAVLIGYDGHRRAYFARVDARPAAFGPTPIAAFRAALTPIVSLLSEDAS